MDLDHFLDLYLTASYVQRFMRETEKPPSHVRERVSSYLEEVSDYTRESLESVIEKTLNIRKEFRKKEKDLKSPEEIYEYNRHYLPTIYELRGVCDEIELVARRISDLIQRDRLEGFLDFGSGNGEVIITVLKENPGLEVCYGDLSIPVTQFAEWRFERKGLQIEILDSTNTMVILPRWRFGVVSAIDVIARDPDRSELITRLTSRTARYLIASQIPDGEGPEGFTLLESMYGGTGLWKRKQ